MGHDARKAVEVAIPNAPLHKDRDILVTTGTSAQPFKGCFSSRQNARASGKTEVVTLLDNHVERTERPRIDGDQGCLRVHLKGMDLEGSKVFQSKYHTRTKTAACWMTDPTKIVKTLGRCRHEG